MGDTQYQTWKHLLIEKSLDAAISQLKKWQQIFDPSWYLSLMISTRLTDTKLDDFEFSRLTRQ
jgi:hypothetical protein